MAFVEPISIKEAIDGVHKKKYLLPAIQREFVWDTYQIERLFDSIMKDYPISSFLFWEVDNSNINNYQFYEFVREYHERKNTHNSKARINGENSITAILDGQQRLTSLYIGLKGTYAYKLPYKRWDNNDAFPVRKLYLNLVAPADDNGDLEYDFRFLTTHEYKQKDENHFWFLVGDILNFEEPVNVNDYLLEEVIPEYGKEKSRYANRTLFKLYEVIHKNKSINFFLEKGESLDKVLNIFIRVNSGGTQLSYSDLLLSIATAQWRGDAREEITSFVDEINSIGDGFNFNKDFVLKSCLVLAGFKDIAFKVDNFNQENMLAIEQQWEDITKAIRSAVILLSSLGYHRDTLTSNNALIPIAAYLHKIKSPDNFSELSKYLNDRRKIFKWLVMVLLKRTFSGQPDNVLRPIREVINQSEDGFPYDEIILKLKGSSKAISFDDDEIDNLLGYQYAQAYTYSALAFIYPSLDFRNKFHQDHIFPKYLFTAQRLKKRGTNDDDIEFYLNNYNYLANLQLLEGVPNQEKSGKDFDVWIKEKYPDNNERKAYMERHYIPNIDLKLENFRQFIEEREKLIISAFKKLLD
ncbi:GmrSD restriction endonuclease domain-containing protein [Nitrosomonas communis]|uniref:GmrSD restriction endonucleases N-terminal domain-containing protein n=1 Tax=Nitrosomonas communis TaxID=44574 RepID=A0A1I4LUE4_9PROT|nr:DUF262 domain-containing protein [Nitrosomonas communis]SFL94559.1 Protein of unknown function DUF262 [Nitrosomonas communis]